MKTVVISGRPVELKERSRTQMKGISIGDSISYRFYDGDFHGVALLFAEPQGEVGAPRSLAITANQMSEKFGLPVVFLLSECPAYERQRLIDKNVYFVVSDKYAHLPMLVANERMRKTKQAKKLSPVAQYLLLFHLQVESLEGKTLRDIGNKVPYSYPSIALGITYLADLGVCEKVADGPKQKVIHFAEEGRRLWDKVQTMLIDPVEARMYCDEFKSDMRFPICSINALAHYTMLNPDPERMIMMSSKQLKEFEETGALVRPNEFDGDIMIEVWKYPPVSNEAANAVWVDKLSLAISLKRDNDPRVEKEVERLINELEWKA